MSIFGSLLPPYTGNRIFICQASPSVPRAPVRGAVLDACIASTSQPSQREAPPLPDPPSGGLSGGERGGPRTSITVTSLPTALVSGFLYMTSRERRVVTVCGEE